ncbi:MAG: protein-tyrosine-phosphatase [Bacteroidota bacterium]
MFPSIKSYCDNFISEFDTIPNERKLLLDKITAYIISKQNQSAPVNLVYICTHNSRRSHFGQVWAKVASDYFGIKNINTFSGGTEATAFNINAINALKRIGFDVKALSFEKNRIYGIIYENSTNAIECFSKVYSDEKNPKNNFLAIMTCSEAEANCPFIPGAELRIGTSYEDPKKFDNTNMQDAKYDERCKQIALETLYVFSKV